MPLERSFVGRYFQLFIDGSDPAGFVRSVEYGGIKGELLAQPVGGQPWKAKSIHNPVCDPITVQCGLSMSGAFFEWIADSWAGKYARKNGSIVTYDHDMKVVYEFEFSEALILETTLPALDATSKEPGFLTVKFQPERGEHKMHPGGSYVHARTPHRQKLFTPADFRLDIDGLAGHRVTKIEQITVKQNAKPMTCGPDWMYQLEPTSLEYPNVTVTFSMIGSKPWFEWHKDFVVDGNNGPGTEKTGAIVLLSQNHKEELFSVELKKLGIVNITPEKSDSAGQDVIRRVKAELYCEEMAFHFGKPQEGGGDTAQPGTGATVGASADAGGVTISGSANIGGVEVSGSVTVGSDGSVSGTGSIGFGD